MSEEFIENKNMIKRRKSEMNGLYDKIFSVGSTKIDNVDLFDLFFDDLKIPINYMIDDENKLLIEMDNFSDFTTIGKTREEEVAGIHCVTNLLKSGGYLNEILDKFAKTIE